MQQALYIIFYAFFFKRKYKQREREREIISLLNKSLSKNFYTIFSPILPNLGRLCFGVSGEKTPGLHQNSLPLSLPTKHSSQQFFVLFSLIPISPPTKHTIKVSNDRCKEQLAFPTIKRERERERERSHKTTTSGQLRERDREKREKAQVKMEASQSNAI